MEDFFKKYYFSVKKFVSGRIDNLEDAEEVVNDIMLAAYNSLPNFNNESNEFTWICGIAKHKIIDFYRKKKIKTILFSTNPIFEEIADKALGPEEESLKKELKKEIKWVMRDLSEGYQKIIRLKYIDKLTLKQIALKLKVSVKSVDSRLMRAKKSFIQKWHYSEEVKKLQNYRY